MGPEFKYFDLVLLTNLNVLNEEVNTNFNFSLENVY